jgi:hypothetical protein
MSKIIKIICYLTPVLMLFLLCTTSTSCSKQNTTCTAVITVQDSAGPVSGATVKLYAPNSTAGGTGYTASNGQVNFSFSLPAIYNISAIKAIGLNDTLKGSGIIQLQVGSSVSTTVLVYK